MHGHELLEQVAALVLVSSGGVLVATAWLARRGAATHGRHRPTWRQPVRYAVRLRAGVVAALSLGAAVIHVAVAPQHLSGYAPFGAAFLALGLLQAATAVVVVAVGVDRLRMPVIVLNLGAVAVWVWSRVSGLPIGPEAWIPEQVGVADAVAAALELALILALLVPVARISAGLRGRRVVDAMSIAVVPTVGIVGIVSLIALASIHPGSH